MDNERKKFLKNRFVQDQKDAFLNTIPLPIATFTDLFDFVNDKLEEEGCDHHLTFTLEFLKTRKIETEKVLDFVRDNGGYCDCEIIYNVEPMFEDY